MFNIKLAIALACNIIIIVGTVLAIASYCKTEEGKYSWSHGSWRFKFFTTDSNVLCAIAAFIVIPFEISALIKGGNLGVFPLVVKYIGAVAVTLTLLTVAFFLGPTQGYREMYKGPSFYTHFLGAFMAIASFCFLEAGKLKIWWIFPAMIPMCLYASLYKHMVLKKGPLNGGWEDFYGFNVRDRWKISLTIMLIGMLLINITVLTFHNAYAV